MIYRFVFTRGRLAILLVGTLLLGVLLFAGGLLSGMRWQLARGEPAAETGPGAETAPGGEAGGASETPAAARPGDPGAATMRPPVARPRAPAVKAPQPRPPAVARPSAGAAAGATAGAVARQAAADASAAGAPAEPAAAPVEPPAATAEPEPADLTPPTIYELQLAVYLQREDAEAFVATMAERGYEAYPVATRGSRHSVIHTVRLGPFPSMEVAATAAARFRADQGFQPIIRFRRRPVEVAPAPGKGSDDAAPGDDG